MMKCLQIAWLAIACLISPLLYAQTNVLDNAGVSFDFDSSQGWAFVDSVSEFADSSNITFVTVDTNTVMRVTAPMGNAGNMAAVISSANIDSLPIGDYQVKLRFRNGTGGLEATAGPLEIRTFIQDFDTWTNFNPSAVDAGQLFGIFKLGGISGSWPNATISDTDLDNDFADSGEWVEVTLDFTVDSLLLDKAFKFLVRIGSAHAATEDVTFEMDYVAWNYLSAPMDTMPQDTMPQDTMVQDTNNVLAVAGIDWNFDSSQGWAFVDSISTNADSSSITFITVDSATVMRVTSPMGNPGDMSALISSGKIDSLSAGEYQLILRFRNGEGGLEATAGPLEIRTFIQDHSTWTNFSPSAVDAGQLIGVFKLGGISTAWPDASISDTDTDNDFAETGEWVEITVDFEVDTLLLDQAFKFLVRIGSAHSAIEDVSFDMDYVSWNRIVPPLDTMPQDTMPQDTIVFAPIDSTVFGRLGIAWHFDSAQGWTFVEPASQNTMASDITFVTVQDTVNDSTATVMRVTAPMGNPGAMAAVISSDKIDTLPSGDYHMFCRLRNGTGGLEATAGALEIRTFLQDHDTWTNFSPSALDAGQVFGIFKLGGISPTWPDATISDTDDDDDFAETGEWVIVTFDFKVTDTLYDKAFKFLVRIGDQHTAIEDVNFEIDYIQWNTGALPTDTMATSIQTIFADHSVTLFPNPATDIATLRFNLKEFATGSLAIYSLSGQQVKAYRSQAFYPGRNDIELDLSDLNQGLYIYSLRINDEIITGKLSLEK